MIRLRIAALLATVCGAAACSGPSFDIIVGDFRTEDGCMGANIAEYVVFLDQPPSPRQCMRGTCTTSNANPSDCLEGVETPVIESDRQLIVTVGFYDASRNREGCGMKTELSVGDGDEIFVRIDCADLMKLNDCPSTPPMGMCMVNE